MAGMLPDIFLALPADPSAGIDVIFGQQVLQLFKTDRVRESQVGTSSVTEDTTLAVCHGSPVEQMQNRRAALPFALLAFGIGRHGREKKENRSSNRSQQHHLACVVISRSSAILLYISNYISQVDY